MGKRNALQVEVNPRGRQVELWEVVQLIAPGERRYRNVSSLAPLWIQMRDPLDA
jgi:hypothetical protein